METKKTRHGKPYLYEVDLMRVIFIFGVLLNHTTTAFAMAMTDGLSKTALHATHLSLHFTRMGFMFMTGLVLFLNYYDRNTSWKKFWQKRYFSTGIPYLAWNAILLVATAVISGTVLTGQSFWTAWTDGVLHGNHFYLYYVFVIFQLYLIFPLIIKLFKKFPNAHGVIMGISFVTQLLLLVAVKYWVPHLDTSSWLYIFRAYGLNILMYQVYFFAGAYTAIHYRQVTQFIMAHSKVIVWIAAGLGIGTVGLYAFNMNILKLPYSRIQTVQQPYIMIYALMMVAVVFYLGKKYAYQRTHGLNPWIEKLVATSSKLSFGIYLVQTIPILLLDRILASLTNIPNWLLFIGVPIGYLFVLGGSVLIAYFCYRVVPFGILIGRPNRKKKRVLDAKPANLPQKFIHATQSK
ncbi:acyltransferase [Pediococcus siamensis]|uniref:acyltransferase n=1 Tax=Pediococcus siamensis TaxID=381829 RepID=UPI0039A06740